MKEKLSLFTVKVMKVAAIKAIFCSERKGERILTLGAKEDVLLSVELQKPCPAICVAAPTQFGRGQAVNSVLFLILNF